MQHLDPDRLVLLALSEEDELADESAHLAQCPGCRHDFDAFRSVADLGVQSQELQDLPAPPERIWRAIEAELPRGTVVPLRRRKSRRLLIPAIAAAAAAVLAVAGTVVVNQFTGRPSGTVTARATLTPLEKVPADAGGAVLVRSDGEMEIDVRNLPLTTGFHEVWLIDPDDVTKMVALGNLTGDRQVVLPVPPGTDLNRFRLVDVSDEPHDGDATHSGRSLLRGTLTY
ncbi:anti-sigma factor [Actinoplanes sp. NPDC023936]|uniref:anti-sigma factor n=1 Tax=Actinoplanes sp. NPDC023936 TaxID=3154910 RepID=UPI0033C97C80